MRPGPLREGASRAGGHLPAWAIERLAFEPEAAPPGAHDHIAGCGECRGAVDRLLRERAAFLAERPPAPFLARVDLRAGSGAPRWPRRWILGAATALAASVVAVLGVQLGSREGVRFKGEPAALVLFVGRDGAAARPLDPAEPLRPGDLLRFGVVSARSAQALVASIDEEGRFSRYWPAAGAGAVEGRDSLQLLPGSVVLDRTTGREWIVLVVAPGPIDEKRVEAALRRARGGGTGGELGRIELEGTVVVVPVRKVPR